MRRLDKEKCNRKIQCRLSLVLSRAKGRKIMRPKKKEKAKSTVTPQENNEADLEKFLQAFESI